MSRCRAAPGWRRWAVRSAPPSGARGRTAALAAAAPGVTRRGACAARQVRHAEQAGAVAAIVYDDVNEALIIMSRPRDHAETSIPAVFVAQKTGIVMRKLMTPGLTFVRITPVRERPYVRGRAPRWCAGTACHLSAVCVFQDCGLQVSQLVGRHAVLPGLDADQAAADLGSRTAAEARAAAAQITDAVWMSMLLSAFAGVLAVTVVVATFYFIRCAASTRWRPCLPLTHRRSAAVAAHWRTAALIHDTDQHDVIHQCVYCTGRCCSPGEQHGRKCRAGGRAGTGTRARRGGWGASCCAQRGLPASGVPEPAGLRGPQRQAQPHARRAGAAGLQPVARRRGGHVARGAARAAGRHPRAPPPRAAAAAATAAAGGPGARAPPARARTASRSSDALSSTLLELV